MRRTRIIGAVAVAFLVSCVPHEQYVKADASTFQVLAPYTRAGIDGSDKDAAAKQDLHDLVNSWEFRIRQNGGMGAK